MDMKKLFLALGVCAVMGISALSAQQVKFEDYFLNKTHNISLTIGWMF